ncbi:MAG TPA: rhodanese-like domain-containing protein [Stellaceae bacterium]|nr:rhodanese-like domain-containing protein [Stellaceae bacterium]
MLRFLDRLRGGSRRPEPGWIEPGELHRRLDAGDPLRVVDVRGPDEFNGPLGHIAGAVNLPLGELPARLAELTADRRSLVCVCLTDKRSAQAAGTLAAAGYGDVMVLRGGMQRWREEGFGGAA